MKQGCDAGLGAVGRTLLEVLHLLGVSVDTDDAIVLAGQQIGSGNARLAQFKYRNYGSLGFRTNKGDILVRKLVNVMTARSGCTLVVNDCSGARYPKQQAWVLGEVATIPNSRPHTLGHLLEWSRA